MRNISKKTRKKINKILLSNHFKKKLGVTQDTLVYTPNPESPLSAIWHHIEIRYDGTIFGYLLDDKVKYAVIGSVNRRKARQTIRSPEQFFHPRCHFARQSKQIAFRLKKMGEDKLARIFDDDAALLLIINMWNLEIEDMNNPMTATWFREDENTNKAGPRSGKSTASAVTSEVLYYDMVELGIPFECEKWHLNRLLTLIRVCNEKHKPPKKVSKSEQAARRKALNAKRKKELGTRG